MKSVSLSLAVAAVVAVAAKAEVIEVNPGESIKAAIAAAADNDTVLIKAGLHEVETESITLPKQALTLQGEDGAVIDGSNMTSGDYFLSFQQYTWQKFVVTNLVFQKFKKGVLQTAIGAENVNILGCAFNDNGDLIDGPANGGALRFPEYTLGLQVRGCSFSGNKATNYGGAVYTVGSKPTHKMTFKDCVFTNGNTAVRGGACAFSYGGSQVIENCLFRDNVALKQASEFQITGAQGGVAETVGRILMKNCRIEGKHMITYGANGDPWSLCATIDNCDVENTTFTGEICAKRTSGDGGVLTVYGGYIYSNYGAKFKGCAFTGIKRAADDDGGTRIGLLLAGDAQLTAVEDCRFVDNNIYNCGYGIIAYNGSSANPRTVRNCLFANNGTQAALDIISSTTGNTGLLSVDNCTILHSNQRVLRMNGSSEHGSARFRNCILIGTWSESANYSVERQACVDSVSDGDFVSVGHGLYIPKSYCVDTLVDQGVPLDWHAEATDIAGRPRVVNGFADIGCYERQESDPDEFIVKAVATAADKEGDWADAFVGAKAALDYAVDGDKVSLKCGTYLIDETLVISNKSITVEGEMYGGVLLDGQAAHRIMFVHHGPQNDQYWIPNNYRQVQLCNLTFTNGFTTADDGQLWAGTGGGLILCGRATKAGETPSLVTDCEFVDCHADNGGALGLLGGKFTGCYFANNTAVSVTGDNKTGNGGAAISMGIYKGDAQAREDASDDDNMYKISWFDNCVFTNNAATYRAAAVSTGISYYSSLRMSDCKVYDCRLTSNSSLYGLAIYMLHNGYISHCVFKQSATLPLLTCYGSISCQTNTRIEDCEFEGFNAQYGVISGDGGSAKGTRVDRCRFINNRSYDIVLTVDVRNSLFVRDTGSVYFEHAANHTVTFDNCTLVQPSSMFASFHNSAGLTGQSVTFRNCILWSTSTWSGELVGNLDKGYGTVTFDNVLFKGEPFPNGSEYVTYAGNKIVSENVGFRNPAGGDYSLRFGSAARDQGAVLDWMDSDSVDLAGNARIVKNGVSYAADPTALPDLGCYELQTAAPGMVIWVQ